MKALFAALSPAGAKARLQVFIFHRVLPAQDPLFPEEITADRFEELCVWISRWFNVLPLDQAVARLKQGSLPARAAAITFDDGYADNCRIALPILQRHGLPATVFVATGFIDGGRMWNDTVIETIRSTRHDEIELGEFGVEGRHPMRQLEERRATLSRAIQAAKYLPAGQRADAVARFAQRYAARLPDDLMLTSAEVQALHAGGVVIGAHTVNHPILATLTAQEAEAEISRGRRRLEELLGQRVGLFAYPNGKPGTDYLPEHARLVESLGFDAAVSTVWGAAHAASPVYELPRFTPWDRSRLRFGVRVLRQVWQSRPGRQVSDAGYA